MSSDYNLDLFVYSLATDFSGADKLWDAFDNNGKFQAIKFLLHHPLCKDHNAKSQVWFYLLQKPWPKLETIVSNSLIEYIGDILDGETFEQLINSDNEKSYLVLKTSVVPVKSLLNFCQNNKDIQARAKCIETIARSSSSHHWLRLALEISLKHDDFDWLTLVAHKWPHNAPPLVPFLMECNQTTKVVPLLDKLREDQIAEGISFCIQKGDFLTFEALFEALGGKDKQATQWLAQALEYKQRDIIQALLPFSNLNEVVPSIVSCIEEKDMDTLKILAPFVADLSDLTTLVATRAHATNKPEKKEALREFGCFVVKEELKGVVQEASLHKPLKPSSKKM